MMIELRHGIAVDPQHIVSATITGSYPDKQLVVQLSTGNEFVIGTYNNPDFSADKLYAEIMAAKQPQKIPDEFRTKALQWDRTAPKLAELTDLFCKTHIGDRLPGEHCIDTALRAVRAIPLVVGQIRRLDWAVEQAKSWEGGIPDAAGREEHRGYIKEARKALNDLRRFTRQRTE